MEKKKYNGGATPMFEPTVDVTQEFVNQEVAKAVTKYKNKEELDYLEHTLVGMKLGNPEKDITPYDYCYVRDL